MTSRKYEKATPNPPTSSSCPAGPGASSFWKKSPIAAIPGRPNQSLLASGRGSSSVLASGGGGGGGGGGGIPSSTGSSRVSQPKGPAAFSSSAAASFRVFEASVSDAWSTANDDPPAQLHQSAAATATALAKRGPSAPTETVVNGSQSAGHASSSISTVDPGGGTPTTQTCSKMEKIEKFLSEQQSIDLEELRRLSWSGLTPRMRSTAWKILCGYLPGSVARQEQIVQRKQDEYRKYVEHYFVTKDQDIHQETYRQIHIDIPRMSPVIGLFQQKCVQEIFERILYIWAIRHPASGYVQGINDLVTPFFLVFLQDHFLQERRSLRQRPSPAGTDDGDVEDDSDVEDVLAAADDVDVAKSLTPEAITAIEADSFWCLTKVLDGIQDNYTFAQPGIQLKVKQLEELVQRIDQQLHEHLVKHEVLYLQFAFRWMNNILMREIPIRATIRLWDTYLSEGPEGFSHFHLYVCAAFLTHWKTELMKKSDFHTLLMFLQNLPTAKWAKREIDLLVAEAFRLKYLFANAPKHLAKPSTTTTTSLAAASLT